MIAILLLVSLLLPVVLAAGLWLRVSANVALRLAPWAAAPALFVAITGGEFSLDIPWLLLGTSLGLDEIRRLFLLVTAGLWTLAGIYAGAYHARDLRRRAYFTFHLITLAGNLGLVVALDAVSFYLGFVVMSFAAYGMVIHVGSAAARRAARIYIVLVLIGEAMILPGLWSAVSHAPTTALADVAAGALAAGPVTLALLALGFGVKAGLVPLHMWLPLAHPAAPTPASAVLSGAMIKAGVLGWIGFLPAGLATMETAAGLFILGGFLNAFFGAVIGVCQSRPKTVLAYSSISQMGFIMIGFGVALHEPGAAPAALFAVAVYCLHHGLAKGALFLGVGVVERTQPGALRRRLLILLALPALALAGAPLTSGFVAKLLVKDGVYGLGWPALELLLGLSALGTTLLMIRFLALMRDVPAQADHVPILFWAPWALLLAAGLAAAWMPAITIPPFAALRDSAALWSGIWPILLGILLGGALALGAGRGHRMPAIPEGDLISPIGRMIGAVGDALRGVGDRWLALCMKGNEAAERGLRRLRRTLMLRYLRREEAFAASHIAALNVMAILALLIAFIAVG